MRKLNSFFKSTLALALVFASLAVPTRAKDARHSATLYARVADAGQVINKMEIDFGDTIGQISGVDIDTFTIHAKGSTEMYRPEDVISYGDYDKDRQIVKVETDGSKVTLYFHEADGAGGTLAYLAAGRNYPVELEYTITQNMPIQVTALDGRIMDYEAEYYWDGIVHDSETSSFTSVDDEINYQFYDAGDADKLIVWFHGNGEGDYNGSENNVAQMLANRGTVAWATDEAQDIFNGAHVMSFQAPDTWYYAQNDGLLEIAYEEINEVIKDYGVDPNEVYVSGCSAGGYMTTRMLIAYPDLFKAAMINCPALDVATSRGGETPTDEELASLRDSRTAIWLVQGITDSSVKPEDCSERMFKILTEGEELIETTVEQELNSNFTTYETADDKYKLSLYETVDVTTDDTGREKGKIEVAVDLDQDGVLEAVAYSDHWTWIYTLNNNPEDADGTHIMNWAANYLEEAVKVIDADATVYSRVADAGQVINKMVIDFGEGNEPVNVNEDTFTVHAKGSTEKYRPEDVISYGDYDKDRQIVKVETDGSKVILYFHEADGAGGTLAYLAAGRNYPVELEYTITQNIPIETVIGDVISEASTYTWDGIVHDSETSAFTSVDDEINYQFYDAGDADKLIVWFHGNGEGDYNGSENNVAQMLANRGTVAWATDEAQDIFNGAHVMSFQAPDTWYYAQDDGLLEIAYEEINEVIKDYGVDPNEVYVSGCSAGGYMTTRMLIAYPDLFKAAMINCPALDVATSRGGETPTDEELASLRDSRTAIWLVQGITDSSVKPEDCSERMFKILTEGEELIETTVEQELNSNFTTYETADDKYKLSLYETVDVTTDDTGREKGKIEVAVDLDQDGVLEAVAYSDHWTWIYTLNNNPEDADGTHIMNWAANYTKNVDVPEGPTDSVDTGDYQNISIYTFGCVMGFVGLMYCVSKRRKETY